MKLIYRFLQTRFLTTTSQFATISATILECWRLLHAVVYAAADRLGSGSHPLLNRRTDHHIVSHVECQGSVKISVKLVLRGRSAAVVYVYVLPLSGIWEQSIKLEKSWMRPDCGMRKPSAYGSLHWLMGAASQTSQYFHGMMCFGLYWIVLGQCVLHVWVDFYN